MAKGKYYDMDRATLVRIISNVFAWYGSLRAGQKTVGWTPAQQQDLHFLADQIQTLISVVNHLNEYSSKRRRMMKALILATICLSCAAILTAQDRQQFIRVDASTIALTNVRVIDGTGAAPADDQTILIENGKISIVGPTAAVTFPAGTKTLDLSGYTVLPGLVGMHNHLFFPMGGNPPLYSSMALSFSRLYLAMGVTTIRTTGSVAPYTDLEIKRLIDSGQMIGPKMDVTGPYFEGEGAFTPVMHQLKDAEEARKMVNYWADLGVTSFKAYMNITRAELKVLVDEAHKRGLKVTGHLCSVTYREAAEIGIDDLEHGLLASSDFVPNKKPDVCQNADVGRSLRELDVNNPAAQELIRVLVEKGVALTSTLPVFEGGAPLSQSGIGAARAVLNQRMLATMSNDARIRFLSSRAQIPANSPTTALIRKSMDFERAFVKAGGLLIAGLDPTGNGGVVAGFGDHRQVQLLVEAGFTPVEAIKIASFNGAKYLGREGQIGSIAAGKAADLMIVKGNPATNIFDIENVEIVFKDGVGYDSEKLVQSVQGWVGIR
jgi:imidazolonepropionase-like amidohydrolase